MYRARRVLLAQNDLLQAQMVEHTIQICRSQNRVAKLKDDFNQVQFENKRLQQLLEGKSDYLTQDRWEDLGDGGFGVGGVPGLWAMRDKSALQWG